MWFHNRIVSQGCRSMSTVGSNIPTVNWLMCYPYWICEAEWPKMPQTPKNGVQRRRRWHPFLMRLTTVRIIYALCKFFIKGHFFLRNLQRWCGNLHSKHHFTCEWILYPIWAVYWGSWVVLLITCCGCVQILLGWEEILERDSEVSNSFTISPNSWPRLLGLGVPKRQGSWQICALRVRRWKHVSFCWCGSFVDLLPSF